MKNTKEEILTPEDFIDANYHARATDHPCVLRCDKTKEIVTHQELLEKYTTHLTDQIKSMENYISDVDGQVKELRNKLQTEQELGRMRLAGISTAAIGYYKEGEEIHEEYNTVALQDVCKLYLKYEEKYSQLESLQKEKGIIIPEDFYKFYGWANEKFQTDGKGSYKVVRDGCITFYSTNELYKDWKRGLL